MKSTRAFFLAVLVVSLGSCTPKQPSAPVVGTWELIAATATQQDSTFSTYNPKLKMIKIITPTHFAFLSHDVNRGKDSSATAFSAGGGKYTLVDSVYTEQLDYYVDKEWENKKFRFVVAITGDTLVQKGVEKIEKLGIDRVIVETYKRVNE